MALTIYNTMTGKKEPFQALREGKVGMYVCGVTVYDLSHIGHARAAIVFDVIYRYLKHKGYDVTYVRNYTDVDDKIINKAQKEEVSAREIAERYIAEYDRDMAALNVETPSHTPRATEHIKEMIKHSRAHGQESARLPSRALLYAFLHFTAHFVEKTLGPRVKMEQIQKKRRKLPCV